MSDAKKITMHLEATDGIQNSDAADYFVSGPLLIFAEVDTLEDLYGDELKAAILESDFYNSRQSIIVFVKQLFDGAIPEVDLDPKDSIKYRGSYFMYDYTQEDPADNAPTIYESITYKNTAWEEILIGTHTHDNKELLDKLSRLDAVDNSGFIEVIRTGDGYDFNIRNLEKQIPALPKYIENAVRDNKILIEYPEDSEYNHLDGTALYRIDDPTALAQCSDLYEYFRTLGKRLYVARKDGVLSLSDARTEISARVDAYEVLSQKPSGEFQGKLIYNFTTGNEFINLSSLVFIDNSVVNPLEYTLKVSQEHNNIVSIIFDNPIPPEKVITLLTLENGFGITVKEVYDAISEDTITLYDIKTRIFEIYINTGLQSKKEVPKVYLTNDDEGNLVWENRLLPAQSFYCQHKYLYAANYETKNGYLSIIFDNVYFDYKYDFPLIMIDQLFAFDAEYFTVGEKHQDLKLRIPESYFKGDSSEQITLIVIKNTMGNAISQEMLRNYVSKEDAVKILSHGSITLDDFVKYTDLDNYAFKAHTHSNFALVGHTHDYRYADYRHTHAEYVTSYQLLRIINKLALGTDITDDDICDMSESLVTNIQTSLAQQGFIKVSQIDSVFRDAGFRRYSSGKYDGDYYLSSDSIYLNQDEISPELLEKLLYDGESVETLMMLNFTELTARILEIFNRDTVEDEQVLLTDDIIVYNPVGGIKEFDKNGYRNVIKKGTDYHTILNDMLNPYISKENIEEMLIPVRTEFKFYSDEECTMEISPDHTDYEDSEITIYAKFIRYINKFGENCEYTYSIHEHNHTVKMDIDPNISANVTITPIDGDNVSPVQTQTCSRIPDRDDVVFAFKINPNMDMMSVVEIYTKTLAISSIYDNRGNEVISEFLPMDVASGDYFFNFEKCLAEYTIINGNDTIVQEFNSDIMITIPANSSEIRTIIIAYQKKQLENRISIMYGQTSILTSFIEFVPESYTGDVNPTEYYFIKYEVLPLDTPIDICVYLDKSNVMTVPVYGHGSSNNTGSSSSLNDAEVAQIYNKLQMVEDFMKSGLVRITDLELEGTDQYILGKNIYPKGHIILNKEVPESNIIISLEYGPGSYNSNFDIHRDQDIDTSFSLKGIPKKIGYGYRFELNANATALTDYSTLTVLVDDGFSNDNKLLDIKFRPRIKHGIYAPGTGGLDLSSTNVYAGTYDYDFFIQTENAEEGEYIVLAIPGDVEGLIRFEVNSFEGGFDLVNDDTSPPECFGRFIEDGWRVYKSVNENLGQVLVHVYTIGNEQEDSNTSYIFGQLIPD